MPDFASFQELLDYVQALPSYSPPFALVGPPSEELVGPEFVVSQERSYHLAGEERRALVQRVLDPSDLAVELAWRFVPVTPITGGSASSGGRTADAAIPPGQALAVAVGATETVVSFTATVDTDIHGFGGLGEGDVEFTLKVDGVVRGLCRTSQSHRTANVVFPHFVQMQPGNELVLEAKNLGTDTQGVISGIVYGGLP